MFAKLANILNITKVLHENPPYILYVRAYDMERLFSAYPPGKKGEWDHRNWDGSHSIH